jgi:hypothetical protein
MKQQSQERRRAQMPVYCAAAAAAAASQVRSKAVATQIRQRAKKFLHIRLVSHNLNVRTWSLLGVTHTTLVTASDGTV